jgi:hypothetical protein
LTFRVLAERLFIDCGLLDGGAWILRKSFVGPRIPAFELQIFVEPGYFFDYKGEEAAANVCPGRERGH